MIEASTIELDIVRLLAVTAPDWQFSMTRKSLVFASHRNGWHREEEGRAYVTGLSGVLDTVSGVVQRHRGGTGGRMFVTRT